MIVARTRSFVLEILFSFLNSEKDESLFLGRHNERNLMWMARDTWTCQTKFLTPNVVLGKKSLILEGIDTVGTVYLNNITVGRVANVHRRYVFEITDFLAPYGMENILQIVLESATAYANARAAEYQRDLYPVPYSKQLGNIAPYNFVRKPASDFGASKNR